MAQNLDFEGLNAVELSSNTDNLIERIRHY